MNGDAERREIVPDIHCGDAAERAALFSVRDLDEFSNRWREIQGGFVDEPRRSVEEANQFVETVIERLTVLFASERAKLENQWREGKDASTEDLRQALPVPLVFRPALVDLTKAIAGG
jgi:hypothetical protein